VEIVRSVEIGTPIDAVFAFVADPRNDVRWCPKVRSVEEVGDGRYTVVHKPVPGKPERRLDMTRVTADPPRRIEWREDDGTDVFEATYELEDLGGRTRFTQRSVAELGAPRLLRPLYRAGIGRDIARQLKELKKLLEE
jgi:carbon monoxide dehydrogenase subunit G